jgi:hypothetical protein
MREASIFASATSTRTSVELTGAIVVRAISVRPQPTSTVSMAIFLGFPVFFETISTVR